MTTILGARHLALLGIVLVAGCSPAALPPTETAVASPSIRAVLSPAPTTMTTSPTVLPTRTLRPTPSEVPETTEPTVFHLMYVSSPSEDPYTGQLYVVEIRSLPGEPPQVGEPLLVYECCMRRAGDTIDSIAFSPDGSLLAISMVSQGDPATDIYRAIWDGQRLYNLVQLTATDYVWELYPVWIGDGSRLLFNRVNNISLFSYWTMEWDGTHQQLLLDQSGQEALQGYWFARDGDLVVYTQWHDDTLHLFASRLSDLTHAIELTTASWGFNEFLAFSPDAARVLVVRRPPGALSGATLLSVSIEGGDEQVIFAPECWSIWSASWSPDGQWIAFSATRRGLYEIYIIRPDGSGLRRVTTEGTAWKTSPTWAIARQAAP